MGHLLVGWLGGTLFAVTTIIVLGYTIVWLPGFVSFLWGALCAAIGTFIAKQVDK